MGWFSNLLGLNQGNPLMSAAKKNRAELDGLNDRGFGYIDDGEKRSAGALNDAGELFDGYLKSGNTARTRYDDFMGLNGADAQTRAGATFKTDPGYQFEVDQNMQAAERGASAGGMLASGNLLAELQDRSSGLASRQYGSFMDRLAGVRDNGLNAAGAKSGILTNLANLYQGTTGQRLGFDSSIVSGRMDANNMRAQGKQQNAAGWANLGGKLMDFGTKIVAGM